MPCGAGLRPSESNGIKLRMFMLGARASLLANVPGGTLNRFHLHSSLSVATIFRAGKRSWRARMTRALVKLNLISRRGVKRYLPSQKINDEQAECGSFSEHRVRYCLTRGSSGSERRTCLFLIES